MARQFAACLFLAVRDWEQKRRFPDRTARVLLAVIDRHPEAVLDALDKAS